MLHDLLGGMLASLCRVHAWVKANLKQSVIVPLHSGSRVSGWSPTSTLLVHACHSVWTDICSRCAPSSLGVCRAIQMKDGSFGLRHHKANAGGLR